MNIYEALNKIIKVDDYDISNGVFNDEIKNNLNTETDKTLFELIRKISSLHLQISTKSAEFCPGMIWKGKRTFATEDLSEEDFANLYSLELSKMPLNLKARVADILWLEKKDYKMAQKAAETYFQLFILWFYNEWFHALEMLERAICISRQIKMTELHNKCCQTVYDYAIKINGKSEDFLSIKLVEILLEQSYGDLSEIIKVIENIIKVSRNNPHKAEHAFKLKTCCLDKIKDVAGKKRAELELAEYLTSYADGLLEENAESILIAQTFYLKAINICRNNGKNDEADKIQRKLLEAQKEIPKLMKAVNIPYDSDKIKKNIYEYMNGRTFEKCVIKLAQMVTFHEKSKLKQEVIDEFKSNPISMLVSKDTINSEGQTVSKLPALDISHPEDEEKIEMHTRARMLKLQEISGEMHLSIALSYIREHFEIEKEKLDFLVRNNAVVPPGREEVLCSAIKMALIGKYYDALHILAPQVENIFRYIAEEVGGLTVTLSSKGISEKKGLSKIFKLPELNECYDNDALFLFEGLLNAKTGANIRNRIAHGIMEESESYSGECLFFICAVIRLLVYSSGYCIDIMLREKEK